MKLPKKFTFKIEDEDDNITYTADYSSTGNCYTVSWGSGINECTTYSPLACANLLEAGMWEIIEQDSPTENFIGCIREFVEETNIAVEICRNGYQLFYKDALFQVETEEQLVEMMSAIRTLIKYG